VIKNYLEDLDAHKEQITNEELVKLSEYSLKDFLEDEADTYSDKDLIKRYK
jgi:hypothetical protein